MRTLLTRDPDEAAAVLRRGGLCVLPTETVYGLAALAYDADAVRRVFEAKGRPSDNPLIVHLGEAAEADEVAHVTALGGDLLRAFAPGPLTVVLPARPGLPPAVTAGLGTVAVRVPLAPLARAVLRSTGPLVAPSANRSGRPSPTTWAAAAEDLDGRVDAILQGPPTTVGLESTVVDATGDVPLVLRPGAVTLDALEAQFPASRAVAAEAEQTRRSPGTRHRHYAPRAQVHLVAPGDASPSGDAAWIGLSPPPSGYALATVCPDVEAYARQLFDAFRRADAAQLSRIDAEAVPEVGLGVAVMDRLRRAAAG
ncbi:threonylcarbamoyl-AMP synthase [Rubrivirga sp. SAORIC476]|uniref:L-threonylcarbamoyladenylate synthase n=1 Tax=Rubrivirga sp. SAORIC476 TaxID=1961794 RepID=UPI000BA99540|nr:L-threonylcarbamoyladenylate synthase [Rubrivirga sp. SAORIC476]PAP74233.1 threonylcarbamoyl-AMP synthase [Rubrivirga sp. SAORIC476]